MATGKKIRLKREQSTPDEIPLRFTAEVIQSEIDESKQPIIGIHVKNSSETTVQYSTGWFEMFGAYESKEKNPGLVILPEKWPVELQRPLRPSEDTLILDSLLCGNAFKRKNDSSTRRKLWDHPENSGEVFPTGTYSFSSQYLDENHKEAFTWGFSIEVF
jgi:hypothetical protein